MIQKLIEFSLSQRFAVLIGVIALIAGGIWAWNELKIEAYPDVGDTEVSVITKFPGRSAEEVEKQITIPIEKALNSVPRVLTKRSRTIFGLSIVKLTFEEGTNDYFARQVVLEKMNDANLPPGVDTSLGPLTGPVGEILRYVVEGDSGQSPMELRELQDWVIIPEILKAHGVADVSNFGGRVRQFQVILNPSRLDRYKISIDQVSNQIAANNASTGGNLIQAGESWLAVRSIGRIAAREDIENIVLSASSGAPIFLKDVATVQVGSLPPVGILGYTDRRRNVNMDDGVQGLILMRRGENPSEVLGGIKERIKELNESILPKGVHIHVTMDRGELVHHTLDTVGHTLFEGISIVIIVLIFFLGNLRSALAVALTIPLSLLFAFVGMKLTGIPANLLSLGAIDFGIIVDASVVVVEAVALDLEYNLHHNIQIEIREVVAKATRSVGKQIIFAVAIIILAYLPLFTMERVEGKLFSPMAYTLSFAVLGSLLLAVTAVPVFCSFLFADGYREWKNPVFSWIELRYERLIHYIMNRPIEIITLGGGLVVISIAVGAFLGTEFLPELDEGSFTIRCVLPAGISLDQAKTYPPVIRRTIMAHEESMLAISQLGRNDDGTDPYGPNRIENVVQLRPYGEWKKGRTKRDLLVELRSELQRAVPGMTVSFSQPILDNVTEAVTGSAADLGVLISGSDLSTLRGFAEKTLNVIRNVPGASESSIEQEGPQTQLIVEVDRQAAARYGINIYDINNLIELAVGGRPVSNVYEGERKFDIALRYTKGERNTVEAISNILIITQDGMRVPLSEVANIRMADGQTIIARENGKRQISVKTNIRGRDQGGFVNEAEAKLNQAFKLPDYYSVKWGGQYENLIRARKRLMIVIPITVAIIYVILYVLFNKDPWQAGIVMMNVPFGLVGGIFALSLRGYNFSVSSGVGFVSLFGISVMSGVLLVSYTNWLRTTMKRPLREAVVEGAIRQFRPRMSVMTLAMIGLLPAALATGIGSDIQRPLSTVIVGGLFSALLLSLTVMPAIYYIVEKIREDYRARKGGKISYRR